MDTYNHYTEAKALAEQLEKSGHANFAGEIRAALDEGSTGTEIFMRIRESLQRLLGMRDLRDNILARAKELYSRLGEALR